MLLNRVHAQPAKGSSSGTRTKLSGVQAAGILYGNREVMISRKPYEPDIIDIEIEEK